MVIFRKIKNIFKFLWLLFWVYPFKKEEDKIAKKRNENLRAFIIISIVIFSVLGHPRIHINDYPSLEMAFFVEGIVVRKPLEDRGGKYSSEAFGVKTENGIIFKNCAYLGNTCFDNKVWDSYIGKPAKVWYWNDWMIQLKIDDKLVKFGYRDSSYETMKDLNTNRADIFLFFMFSMPIVLWFSIRVFKRYFRMVINELSFNK